MHYSKRNEDSLGSVVFSCQPRPIKEYLNEIEGGHYICFLGPLFFIIISIFVFGFVVWLFEINGPLINRLVWMIVMFLFIVMGFFIGVWWYCISPQKDYLSVHQNGFQWRMKLGRWNHFSNSGAVLYNDLKNIQFRADFVEPNIVEKKNTNNYDNVQGFIMDLFFPKGDLKLTFGDGEKKVLGNIMKRFSSKDIECFIGYIQNKHPELLQME